jgi:hypothetical protein
MEDIRTGVCPICRHPEIIESRPGPYDYTEVEMKPLMIAFSQRSERGGVTGFTCRSCGFTQLFAAKPGEIPIGPETGTRLVRGEVREEPYR